MDKRRQENSPRAFITSALFTLLPILAFFIYISFSTGVQAAGVLEFVEISSESYYKVANPGGVAVYNYLLRNTDTDLNEGVIEVDAENGTTVTVQNPNFSLAGGESRNVIVEIAIAASTSHGVVRTTTIRVNPDDPTTTVPSDRQFETGVVVPGGLAVSVSGGSTETAAPGQTVEFDFTINNNGSEENTFDLSATTPNGFQTSIRLSTASSAIQQVTIAANQSVDVIVAVTASNSSISGQNEIVTFTATSQLDPSVSASDTGTVRLSNPTATPTTSNVIFADQYEPNGTIQTATEILPGTSNRLCDATFWPKGDIDFYVFPTQPGLQYFVGTEDLDSGIDPYMTLYDPNGNPGVSVDNVEEDDLNAGIGFIAGSGRVAYVSVQNRSSLDPDNKTYCIKVTETLVTPSPTPSNTPTPTETPENTPTITLTPSITPDGDDCEPNDTANTACFIAIGQTASGDFSPAFEGISDDKDFYQIFARRGIEYTCTTLNLSSYADTTMEVRQAQGYVWLGDNNDKVTLDPTSGSEVTFRPAIDGDVYIIIRSFTRPQEGIEDRYTYDLRCEAASPTATPEPTGTPEPTATVDLLDAGDDCEPNDTPNDACFITAGQTLGNNFAPPPGASTDTDYFRMFARRGVLYTCATFNLSAFADTRLEIRQEQGFVWLGDNNDAEPFNPTSGSEVSFQAQIDGNIFLIVRPFTKPEEGLETQYTYDIRCASEAPTITPTWPPPTATLPPTATPRPVVVQPPSGGNNPPPTAPPTETPLPVPTQPQLPTPTPFQTDVPTPTPVVNVNPLETPVPTVTPQTEINLDVLIYYDANESFSAESTEGVMDIAVLVYDNATGELLSFGSTNANGIVTFPGLQPQGNLRVNVEFLNFSQIVPVNIGRLDIRISPQQMPDLIP